MILLISLRFYSPLKAKEIHKVQGTALEREESMSCYSFPGESFMVFFPKGQAFPFCIFLVCKNSFCNVADFLLFQVAVLVLFSPAYVIMCQSFLLLRWFYIFSFFFPFLPRTPTPPHPPAPPPLVIVLKPWEEFL